MAKCAGPVGLLVCCFLSDLTSCGAARTDVAEAQPRSKRLVNASIEVAFAGHTGRLVRLISWPHLANAKDAISRSMSNCGGRGIRQ